jgi:hypothetical protein
VPAIRAFFALLFVAFPGFASAQSEDPARADTVSWSAQPATTAERSDRLNVIINGAVQPGWHVYALKQAPDGPTPLLVTLDANAVATADGVVAGSAATKLHDPAFGLDTQFYSSAFTLTVPVRLKPHLTDGPVIPLNVRYQTCNGRVCQPPRTVHLSVPVNPQAGG